MSNLLTLTRATWLAFIIFCAGTIFYSLNAGLKFDTDILSLLPASPHSQSERIANKALAESSNKRVIFLVTGLDNRLTKTAARAVQQELISSELFQTVQGQVDAQQLSQLQTSLAQFEYFHLTNDDQESLETQPISAQHPPVSYTHLTLPTIYSV